MLHSRNVAEICVQGVMKVEDLCAKIGNDQFMAEPLLYIIVRVLCKIRETRLWRRTSNLSHLLGWQPLMVGTQCILLGC